jgi:hypothetical protein
LRLAIFALAAVTMLVAPGCDDEDSADGGADDERVRQVTGVAELAIGAYASAGPRTLADYLSSDAFAKCPSEDLEEALAGEKVPTGFREMKNVDFNGDSAEATIMIGTDDGDMEVVWTFVEEGEGSWRIDNMPELENCGA